MVAENLDVPVADGYAVHVRHKGPAAGARRGAAVVFVHGATYPVAATFDLELDGFSWMDSLVRAGWDAYGIDMRGYGGSTRSPAMERPAAEHPPLTPTQTAVDDVARVVEHLRERRELDSFALMGTSWGSSVVGAYAATGPAGLVALVQHAPQWLRDTPSGADPGGELGAYRRVPAERMLARWLGALAEERLDESVPPAWRDAFVRAAIASDPGAGATDPPSVRAPNGAVLLTREYWGAGKPFYDPARIRIPTLVIHGDRDRDIPTPIGLAYFRQLANARGRRFVEIGDGTHMMMLERVRLQFFAEIELFLNQTA